MSKNTRTAAFRKVDVDELDDEKYQEDDDATAEPSSPADSFSQRESEIKKLVSASKNMEALKIALEDPPLNSKDADFKKRNFDMVLDVLTRFKQNDIEKSVGQLSTDEVDVLMKYIYRGFAEPTEKSCGILLVWHQHAVSAGGVGSIVRVMTSRKTV